MNRTVVVTGGSRGIGRALCRAFAEPGVHVCFTFHSRGHAGEETAEDIRAAGATAMPVRADISDTGEANGFFKRVVETTGRVDVLINNAGIAKDSLIPRMKEEDWDAVVATNLKGAFTGTKAVSRQMMKQKSGRIINITSVAGVAGNPGQANYSAAKAGIIGLTKTAAKELAGRGITVNAIAPGFIETEMTASISQSAKDAIVARIPAGRAGTPEDIAGAAVFLASSQAAYITGQVIHINGGLYT